MLAVAALPRLHLALATVNLPLDVERSSALAVSFAIAPPSLIAAPLPALADAIESTAYVLLAVGLTRASTGCPRRQPPTVPTDTASACCTCVRALCT